MSNMVNLLPPDIKTDIIYARRNTRLLWWSLAGLCILICTGVMLVVGGKFIDRARASTQAHVTQIKKENSNSQVEEIKQQADELYSGVSLVSKILSSEILFSKLLNEIGTLMPPNTILGDISLSNKVNGALELTASSVDGAAAAQIQVNLSQKDNPLFEKVDTVNVTCDDQSTTQYRCIIALKALFKANAAVNFTPNEPTADTGASK